MGRKEQEQFEFLYERHCRSLKLRGKMCKSFKLFRYFYGDGREKTCRPT